MALDVPPPQIPAAIEVADRRAFMTGSEVAEALRACAVHPVFDSIPAAALLTRQQLAKALTACGVPTAPATLATKAVRGGGPPYQLYGKVAIYRWGPAVAWALESMSEPACTTSEHRARKASPAAPQKPSPEKLAAMVEGSRRYNADRVRRQKSHGVTSHDPKRKPRSGLRGSECCLLGCEQSRK
jgi:hypothetical protein